MVTRAVSPWTLPEELAGLDDLALDLRWTWSHAGDELWRRVSPEIWERTQNPWNILQDLSSERLAELAGDAAFRQELRAVTAAREDYLANPGWSARAHADAGLRGIAYFSMEFGLGEALPLYAGGLGILAGDYLKTVIDLHVPAVGIGLLYQVGYFRQRVDAAGRQQELYPYNDPTSLPIRPVRAPGGGWLHVSLDLPGRPVLLRVWEARVGCTRLSPLARARGSRGARDQRDPRPELGLARGGPGLDRGVRQGPMGRGPGPGPRADLLRHRRGALGTAGRGTARPRALRARAFGAAARAARHGPESVAEAAQVLDPDALTLGFARRFARYKRPHLLLQDEERLARLLTMPDRPVQLIVAGKAHPRDEDGKRLIEAWMTFVRRPDVRRRAVFLEDCDMTLAEELVQGVDVWINTPQRPWEACGTSGIKVLVNGGLNLSELDGWWAEAYVPEAGWALGDGQEHAEPDWDAREAEALYQLLEVKVVPEFFARDAEGIPRAWLARIRASMAALAPRFSSNRMLRQYVEDLYLPAAAAVRRRTVDGGRLGRQLAAWEAALRAHWDGVRIEAAEASQVGDAWAFVVAVSLGALRPEWVQVELYAEPHEGEAPVRVTMDRGEAISGGAPRHRYHASVPGSRPASDYTPRIVPHHPEARVPMEAAYIRWES